MATHLRTELLVDALQMVIARRKPAPGLVHHSDRGFSIPRCLSERGSRMRGWCHRYELMKRSAAFGFEAMNLGTLYRTLRQSILHSTTHKVTENTQFGRSSTRWWAILNMV
jgi:hypothetical protein